MNFFDHKDLENHLLQLCPKVVKHPVLWHICSKQELRSQSNSRCQRTAQKQHSFIGSDRKQTGTSGNSLRATLQVLLETGFSTVVRAEGL
jgi:hypothetical protein